MRNKPLFCGFTKEEIKAIDMGARRTLDKFRRQNNELFEDAVLEAWIKFKDRVIWAKGIDVADIEMNVWVKFWKLIFDAKRGKRQDGVQLGMKLFIKIVKNNFLDMLKHEVKNMSFPEEGELGLFTVLPHESTEAKITVVAYMDMLERHSPVEHNAVKLIELEGYVIKEAAKIMCCSVESAKKRNQRGMCYLKKIAEKEEIRMNYFYRMSP